MCASRAEAERRRAGADRDSGRNEGERPHERVGEADTAQREDRRPGEQHRSDDASPSRWRLGVRGGQKRPRPQVRDDPRAARERKEREGQPDERRVDCERVSDPGADARNDAVALHA